MDAAGILAILSVSMSGVGALIHTVFTSMSLSRCTQIDCCCMKCIRDVMNHEEMNSMLEHTAQQAEQN